MLIVFHNFADRPSYGGVVRPWEHPPEMKGVSFFNCCSWLVQQVSEFANELKVVIGGIGEWLDWCGDEYHFVLLLGSGVHV